MRSVPCCAATRSSPLSRCIRTRNRETRDPGEAVAAPVVGIAWFLRLQWAIEGQVDLFPGRRFPLLDGWAAEAAAGIG